ncbi:MAG: acylphosphatase [Candidatus Micrarchaeota archaeon]
MKKFLKAIVHGDVQGVGFRYTVSTIARRFAVTGLVRNLADGTVEVQAEGEDDELKKFLKALEVKDGYIRVGKIFAEWKKAEGKFSGFQIVRSSGW